MVKYGIRLCRYLKLYKYYDFILSEMGYSFVLIREML